MRPTYLQLFYNTQAFEEALVAAGMEAAHARVLHVYRLARDIRSVEYYLESYESDRCHYFKQDLDYQTNKRATDKAKAQNRVRLMHRIAETNRQIFSARVRLNDLKKKYDTKVSKWPDLILDEKKLKNQVMGLNYTTLLRKRSRRKSKIRSMGWR